MATHPYRISPDALHRELARRGLSQMDLVNGAGLSWSTMSKVNRGEDIAGHVKARILRYLEQRPVLTVADLVLAEPDPIAESA